MPKKFIQPRNTRLNLENAVEFDCDRLPLETERFFQKSGLTVVVTTASPFLDDLKSPVILREVAGSTKNQ